MQVKIFGKTDCPLCADAQRKLTEFFAQRRLDALVEVDFYDVETPRGLAEGMWYEIGATLPVVIIQRAQDDPLPLVPGLDDIVRNN